MSDIPKDPIPGDEELDLGEVDEADEADAEGQDDADGEGPSDDGDADEEQAGEEEDVERPAREGRQPGRRETQSQRLRRQNAELQRELAEARGFRDGAEQFRSQPQPQIDYAAQQRAQQERADRLALMSPIEAMEFIANEREQRVAYALQQQQVALQDRIDKQAYDQAARGSRVHERYRQDVEKLLASERARGNVGADRESILAYLVGKDAVSRAARAAPAQRKAASGRVASQQTRPTGARGDGSTGGRRPAPGTPEHDDMLIRQHIQAGGKIF